MTDLLIIGSVGTVALINLLLGLVVLKRNPKKLANIVFFLLSIFYVLWALALLLYEYPIRFPSIFYIKATFLIVSFLSMFSLWFSFIFPRPSFKKAWKWAGLFAGVFIGVTIYLLYFTNWWIVNVMVEPGRGLQTIWGQAYTWWLLFVWAGGLWTFLNLDKKAREAEGKEKMQLKYIFYGYALWAISINIPDVIIPFFYNDTSYFSISPLGNLFFSGAVAYSILKHRLMDIRLVIARTISYTLLSIMMIGFYTAALFAVGNWIFPTTINGSQLYVSVALALIVAYTFNPLRLWLEKVTEKIFYKEHYNPQILLRKLSGIMGMTLEIDKLVKNTLNGLNDDFHVEFLKVHLINGSQENRIWEIGDKQSNFRYSKKQTNLLLEQQRKLVMFDDLKEGGLKEMMRSFKVGGIAKLEVKGELLGILVIGNKMSGDIFTKNDLDVLQIIVPQLSVALKNAEQYEEIKNFSEKLKKEVKKATVDLEKANQKLKDLDKKKDEFLSIAAHELRAPMSAVKGYLSMLLSGDAGKINGQATDFLNEAEGATNRLIRLVNNMLNVARIEEGRLVYQMKTLSLKEVVQKVFDELKMEAENKGVEVNFQIEKGVNDQVYVDADRIFEVVYNLINNAVKYTEKGSIKIFLKQKDNQTIRFEVIDTGFGIGEEDQKLIFDKFSRAASGVKVKMGTGLGLYISKLLIEKFGGKIGFESEINKGSTFWFELPVKIG